MDNGRIDRLKREMAKSDMDLAVYGCGPGYQYLTGTANGWRFRADTVSAAELLLVPLEHSPTLLSASDANSLGDTLRNIAGDSDCSRIAVGDQPKPQAWAALYGAFPHATFIPGDQLLSPLRLIKDAHEIETLRKAAAMTDAAVQAALPAIREGISMRELQLEIEMHARRAGATGTSFDIVSGFIAPGSDSVGSIFSYTPDEGLRNGTTIFFDIGFVVDGYCSDWGRSVFFGTPDRVVAEAYRSLQKAVVDTVGAIEVGRTRVCDLYPLIESSLDASGYGDYIRARLPSKSVGHQIGMEVHENPWLEPRNDDLIQPGMVFCMEPKLWDDGRYYLRVEDMVLITEQGAEFLTTFDRELFSL
jgi:Xaa-Pro aminopeptidase